MGIFFYFLKSLAKTQIIIAIIKITIKIPKPIPALKMPSTTSQLVNEKSTKLSTVILLVIFPIMLFFDLSYSKLNDV